MSNSLATIPAFNIYAEPQTAGSIYPTKPILVGEFSFNLDFLEQYFDFEPSDNSVPVVSLSTDVSEVNEGENLALDFELSNPAPAGGLTVELDLIEGSDSFVEGFVFLPEASSNFDNLELQLDESTGDVISAEVTFSEGATDASLVSEIVADNLTEGDETVSIGLVDGDAYDVDSNNDDVSLTIIDTSTSNDSIPVVGLSTDVSKVNEGENLALDFEISNPAPAGGLTVELDLIEGSDSFAEGFVFLPEASSNFDNLELQLDESTGDVVSAEVTFSEGATEASLVSEIVADNLTEGDETVSIGLVDGDAYDVDSNNDDVSLTIIDTSTSNDSIPVVGLSTDVSKVNEGETLALDFELSNPAPAGGLTVELDLIEGSDSFAEGFVFLPEASSNFDNLELQLDESTGDVISAEVTFSEGATEASLVSEIVADNLTEGDETVSIGLVDGDAYDVDSDNDDVSLTIIDTSTDLNSSSIEIEDFSVPFLGDVDFSIEIDYSSDYDREPVSQTAIADSIDNYLMLELDEADSSELEIEDLAEFLVSDSGLGISSVSDSLTVELTIEPNSLIPDPITATSTFFTESIV